MFKSSLYIQGGYFAKILSKHLLKILGKAFSVTIQCNRKIEGCQLDTVTHIRFQSKPFFLYLRFMKGTAYKFIFLIKLNGCDSFSLLHFLSLLALSLSLSLSAIKSISMFLCSMIIHFLFFLNMWISLSPTSDVCSYRHDAYINHEK